MHHDANGIARNQMNRHEDDNRHTDQNRDGVKKAFDDVTKNLHVIPGGNARK
jgi:hypothetical protein